MKVSFFVSGEPKTAGSKRAFPLFKKIWNRIVCPHCSREWQSEGKEFQRNIVTDDTGRAGKEWRSAVYAAAFEAMKCEGIAPFDEPLIARFDFTLKRPQTHYGTGRNSGIVKASAPHVHSSQPDLLKLARAAEDAMKGVVYTDDRKICEEHLYKRYGGDPGVKITVTTYEFERVIRESMASMALTD